MENKTNPFTCHFMLFVSGRGCSYLYFRTYILFIYIFSYYSYKLKGTLVQLSCYQILSLLIF